MPTLLIYGDTVRNPSLRHEVPLEIMDPFLFVEHEGRPHVLTNALERPRIARLMPDAEIVTGDQLGVFDLIEQGMTREQALIEIALRAVQRWGVESAVVPPDLPVAVADRVRAEGIELTVDTKQVDDRRRVKSHDEMAGMLRAQRAAEAGMRAGEGLIRGAERRDGRLRHDGHDLTAETVRDAVRAACANAGAPAPPDIMVTSVWSGGGHDPGSGPLPVDLPIEIDVWPRDEGSACWADMTRTFVNGEVSDDVAGLRDVVRDALEQVRAATKPGVSGRALYDIAAEVVERAGYPTLRTREPGETLTRGFSFGLGHGVGLEVHEQPGLGLAGGEALVAGDVIAIEPGIEGIEGIGGVRYEDLLLVTDDGCQTLTDYPYDL